MSNRGSKAKQSKDRRVAREKQDRFDQMEKQKKEGTLVIRQMTAEERKKYGTDERLAELALQPKTKKNLRYRI